MWQGQCHCGFWFPYCLSNFVPCFFIEVKMWWRHDLPKGHDINSRQWLGWVLRRTKQSCTSPVTRHLDQNYENFKKKDSFLCAGQVLWKMSIPSNEAHMLSNIASVQVTFVNNLFLSVKYELLVPWQIHWATLKQQFRTKIRTEKNRLGTYFFTFVFLYSLTLCIDFYLQTQ